MTETISRLLRDQLVATGMRVDEVAEQAYVPVEVLDAFREGRGSISAAALDRVAYVLAIDPIALRQGRLERRPTATIFFRQGSFPDFREDEDRPKVAGAFERALALLEVNAVLGRAPSLRSRFNPEEPTPEAAKDGYRLARWVRKALGNDVDPLPDATRLLEDEFDILVQQRALKTSRIDALSVKDNERNAAAIILNTASKRRGNPDTARVDLAHELAHVLFDPANGEINLVIDDDGESGRAVTHAERRAGAFAAELLMPAEGLRRLLGEPGYEMSETEAIGLVERARREFVTPIEIAVNHLVNRDYIVHWLRERLIEWARKREPHRVLSTSPDPTDVPSDVLDRRLIEALERDMMTRERARELLGLSPWEPLPFHA